MPYTIVARDHLLLYDMAMRLQALSGVTLIIGLVVLALAAFVAAVLIKPGAFPFQPTFRDNVITLSAMVSVGAALILASAAFRSIDENRRIREQDRQLDFRRRQLDSILTWVQDIKREWASQTVYIDYQSPPGLGTVRAGNDWAVMIAQTFGTDFQNTVRRAATNLDEYIKAWSKAPGEVPDTAEELRESLDEVLRAAYRITTELRL